MPDEDVLGLSVGELIKRANLQEWCAPHHKSFLTSQPVHVVRPDALRLVHPDERLYRGRILERYGAHMADVCELLYYASLHPITEPYVSIAVLVRDSGRGVWCASVSWDYNQRFFFSKCPSHYRFNREFRFLLRKE
jgi:hypothetical protein